MFDSPDSISGSEMLVDVLRLFDLVDHRRGIVFVRNCTAPVGVHNDLVATETVCACALAGREVAVGAEERPLNILHVRLQPVDRIDGRLDLTVLPGDTAPFDGPLPILAVEAAAPAHDQQARLLRSSL